MSAIQIKDITGLVLAGGRGSRMGGVDKGLQRFQGEPLARHAFLRLQPQVGSAVINANRNLATYEAFGAPVWPDDQPGFAGPVAGLLVGLARCQTPYLVTVPCDTPNFPLDLVARLAQALHSHNAEIGMAQTIEDGRPQPQPVFCLLKSSLLDSLLQFTLGGERKIDCWTARRHCVMHTFADAEAFANANTLDELQRLQQLDR